MNDKLDPKELKILSDILALVLEEETGQSTNALEAIKKRAKKNTVTGGALKNLFTSIANNPPKIERAAPKPKRTAKSASSADLLKARSQITELTQDINHLDGIIRTLRRQNESLRSELLLTQKSRAELQMSLSQIEAKTPFKMILIVLSLFCGLFCGIAGTVVVHSLMPASQPNNTIYLN